MKKKGHLPRRNSICLPFLPAIRTMCIQRKNCSGRYGTWSLSGISPRLQYTSRRFGRRLRWIPPTLSILRRYGELDTGSRYRTEHIFRIFRQIVYGRHGSFRPVPFAVLFLCLFPGAAGNWIRTTRNNHMNVLS